MKYLSVLLVISLLFSMTSCGTVLNTVNPVSDSSVSDSSVSDSMDECSHVWNSATCTEPKKCEKCQETEGTALGHTTDSGVCSRCGERFSSWEVGEYTDEFNQPTGKKYTIVDGNGTFSNSATSNSTLFAALQVDEDDIGIMLWEYGSNLVKGVFDYEQYRITILDESGQKHSFEGTIYKGGTRVYFDDSSRGDVFRLLRNNDTLKIHIESTKYSVSTYLFAINTAGFKEAYSLVSQN